MWSNGRYNTWAWESEPVRKNMWGKLKQLLFSKQSEIDSLKREIQNCKRMHRLELDHTERIIKRTEVEAAKAIRRARQVEVEAIKRLGRQGQGQNSDLVKTHLKFLIFACHPDRNSGGREQEATEITKELLKLKGDL